MDLDITKIIRIFDKNLNQPIKKQRKRNEKIYQPRKMELSSNRIRIWIHYGNLFSKFTILVKPIDWYYHIIFNWSRYIKV